MKDSGDRQVFKTGAQCDIDTDKMQPQLISPYLWIGYARERTAQAIAAQDREMQYVAKALESLAIWFLDPMDTPHHLTHAFWYLGHALDNQKVFIHRVSDWLVEGAKKYEMWNWAKGIKFTRRYASALRHILQWFNDENDEDHLAAAGCNISFLMHYVECVRSGRLPAELNDVPDWGNMNE